MACRWEGGDLRICLGLVVSLLIYPSFSDLEQLGMTHGVGEGAMGLTCNNPILFQDSIMLSVDNFGLNIYGDDYDIFVCSLIPPDTQL